MKSTTSERTRDGERLHLILMLALTFSTGVIDAVGYLGLDRVFTGNMTGNVVILGMGLLGVDHLPVIGPLVALACFMGGAVAAGRVLRPIPSGWSGRSTTVLGVVGAILVATAILLVLAGRPSTLFLNCLVFMFTAFNILVFVVNVIPIRSTGHPSDGFVLWKIIGEIRQQRA